MKRVTDRPGHDRRYAVDTAKLTALGWAAQHEFEPALAETVDWYKQHDPWWRRVRDEAFDSYYRDQYKDR